MTNSKDNPISPQWDVLGIGSPALDYIMKVSDSFLAKATTAEEGMVPISYQNFESLLADCPSTPIRLLGGSACNTIKGLALLGHACALFGKIGQDPVGSYIKKVLLDKKIAPLLITSATPTTQIAVLVNADGRRSFRSYLGAGAELKPSDLDSSLFKKTRWVHIEGYTLLNESLTEEAMKKAKNEGAKVSFDLSSYTIVSVHREKILHLLSTYVDLVFANAQEVYALMGGSAQEGSQFLQNIVPLHVILMEKKGCWVGDRKTQTQYPAYPVEAVDTTGAGDFFAAGFLHGVLTQASFKSCAHYGALMGAAVVQSDGAEIQEKFLSKLVNDIQENHVC